MGNPLTDDIYTMKTTKTVSLDDGISWEQDRCPHCGSTPLFVVATALDGNLQIDPQQRTRWLRCPQCLRGSVNDRGTLHPGAMPLREPSGLPLEEAAAWSEVRHSLRARSFRGTVLLCRAIVRRLARQCGLEQDDALLAVVVDHLVQADYLTARMRTWAGRVAPHVDGVDDLETPMTDAVALDVASFTLRTLEAYFELEDLMATSTS